MIIERRDVLFDYETAHQVLVTNYDKISEYLPPETEIAKLKEAYTVDVLLKHPDRYRQIMYLLGNPELKVSDVVFVFLRNNTVEFAHYVPQEFLVEPFIQFCIERKITLPKQGKKSICAEELMIGLRIAIEYENLEFEDEDKPPYSGFRF